ncbi:MAG TPA: hypothetical protein VM537_10720 [Anaerolineae bacterium]|nr:hypothetical protein [Anaerolineae bacterium]
MIAAFLCGLMYGWLGHRTWQQEATRREKHEAFGAFLRQHGSYLKHYREQQNYPKWGDGAATAEDPAHYGKGWGSGDHSGDYSA